MSSPPLLPYDYKKAVREPRFIDDDPRQFSAEVAAAWSRRHPEILDLQGDEFAVSIATAMYLYRRDPKSYRELVLSALHLPTSPNFCQRIAAAARDAWQAQDWSLLGRLAYRLELGIATGYRAGWDSLPSEIADPGSVYRQVVATPEEFSVVQQAFLKSFDVRRGNISAKGYVQVVLAYWLALPTHFVLPPACCLEVEKPLVGGWAILTMICRDNAAAWQAVTGAFDATRKLPHSALQEVIHRLQHAPQEALSRERTLKNPFKKLAGNIALEPKQKRPKKARHLAEPIAESDAPSAQSSGQPTARRSLFQRMFGRGTSAPSESLPAKKHLEPSDVLDHS